MKRKTEIRKVEIFLMPEGWRGRMGIFSTMGRSEKPEDEENFNASINLPLDNPNTTPDEINEEIFAKFLKALEEVVEQLKKKEFAKTY